MGILDFIKRDARRIVTNVNDFAEETVTFIAPTGEIANVQALHTKHHLGYDLQTAQEINTMKGHVCVSEQSLIDLNYPVRDSQGRVSLKNHKVIATDANGVEWTYIVNEFFPNDKVGVISVILGGHEQ